MGLLNQFDRRTGVVGKLRGDWTAQRPTTFLRGSLWRCLIGFLLLIEVVTGSVLMAFYNSTTATAWGSVWHLETQVPGGWLVRGVHHFASDALLVLLLVYAISLLLRRAYRAPAEFLWWTVLLAIGCGLALSLTGELLPWDQQGYWGTTVRANILARTPLVGETLKTWLIGGPHLGNAALARFYALHVALLPAVLFLMLILHRRAWRAQIGSGIAAAAKPRAAYFPWRMVRDTLACAVVLAALYWFAWYARTELGWQLLDAPADPTAADYPARPEWHTVFLFQWLKYFEGPVLEVLGAIIVPGLVVVLLFLLPYAHRVLSPAAGYATAVAITFILLGGAVGLSALAIRDDRDPPDEALVAAQAKQQAGTVLSADEQRILRAQQFNALQVQAALVRERAFALADANGTPPEGPALLLANDPLTRGPRLFAANCSACHRFEGHDGLGSIPAAPATSSDLTGFATREWIRSLLANPMSDRHFGRMKKPEGSPAHTKMAEWTGEQREGVADEQSGRVLEANFDAAAAYLEDESKSPGRLAEQPFEELAPGDSNAVPIFASEEERVRHGRWFFMTVCNECHSYAGERSGFFNAPEMQGYGSVEWLELMIAEPDHETRYRKGAQMPRFVDKLPEGERRLIAEWLHGLRFGPPKVEGESVR